MKMLSIDQGSIVDTKGKKVFLRGINVGGWLMMEGYLLGGRNIAENRFGTIFRRKHGRAAFRQFMQKFRETFIQKKDFNIFRRMGYTCVRIPFHHRILDERGTDGEKRSIKFLDRAVEWCGDNGLYAILDMHGAPGCQNADWHSDSNGKAAFWEQQRYRDRAVSLWKRLAKRYKSSPAVAGYDILNEPVTDKVHLIRAYYRDTIKAIRSTGDTHLIFLEGNRWAQEMEPLDGLQDKNMVYSIHFYLPLDHTFNFRPGQCYPGMINGERWDKGKIAACLRQYVRLQQEKKVPIFVGEFGINLRCYHCGHELRLLKDIISLFNTYQWHWTYWTHKAVAGGMFPNGVYQFLDNPPWVNRQGNTTGWETYAHMPSSVVRSIPRYLATRYFTKHQKLSRILKEYA